MFSGTRKPGTPIRAATLSAHVDALISSNPNVQVPVIIDPLEFEPPRPVMEMARGPQGPLRNPVETYVILNEVVL